MTARFAPGFSETQVAHWEELHTLFAELAANATYIYRGQSSLAFSLRSSLGRSMLQTDDDRGNNAIISRHLQNFRSAIRGRIDLPDRYFQSDEEVWAIGQHFGLATPLLDWTESSYVAAYFAFGHMQGKAPDALEKADSCCSIFALHQDVVEEHFGKELERRLFMLGDRLVQDLEDVMRLVKPETSFSANVDALLQIIDGLLPVSPKVRAQCKHIVDDALEDSIRLLRPRSGENIRLINQKGLFTYTYYASSLEDWVKANFVEERRPVLLKINVPIRDYQHAFGDLYGMNINHATLFPDLSGAAVYCNSLLPKLREQWGSK
jgi:hypothetical protein